MAVEDVRRNYRVVGLARGETRVTVVILKDGEIDPTDTGLTVQEFVDPEELRLGGIFDYFRRSEKAIFRRGLTKRGKDVVPGTRRARDPDVHVGPLEDGTQICRTCRERKALQEFSRSSGSKTGRKNHCKDCVNDATRKRSKGRSSSRSS